MSDSPESLTRMRRKAGSVTDGEPGLDRLALVLVGVDVFFVEQDDHREPLAHPPLGDPRAHVLRLVGGLLLEDRKSTRLNSSHANISYAVFCLKKKKTIYTDYSFKKKKKKEKT